EHGPLPPPHTAPHPLFSDPPHLHVPPERDPRAPVLRPPPPPLDQRAAKSQRKPQNLNPDRLGDEKMAELVNKDEDADDDEKRYEGQHAASCASRRASASAANTSSSDDARAAPAAVAARVTTCSMISAMRPNVIFSSRNSCTATSLAALKRAGAVPPMRAASRPTTYAGKRSGCSASNVSVPAATGSKRRTPWSGTRSG